MADNNPQWAVERAKEVADEISWSMEDAATIIARALAEAAKPKWTPLAEYKLPDRFESAPHMWCFHSEKRWMRMGVYYAELGRWYYSGTNELSQWSAQPGDEPTHVTPLPAAPEVG